METEKLDRVLRSSVLKYEETNIPEFDRKRVWRKSTGNRRTKNLATVISAAAIVVLALSFLLTSSKKEADKQQVRNMTITSQTLDQPVATFNARPKQKTPVLLNSPAEKNQAISITGTADFALTVPDQIQEQNQKDPGDIKTQQVAPLAPVVVSDTPPAPSTEVIKVIFKPGRSEVVQSQPEMRVTFKKGAELRPDPKLGPAHEAPYLVNTQNPFRLRFKSADNEN